MGVENTIQTHFEEILSSALNLSRNVYCLMPASKNYTNVAAIFKVVLLSLVLHFILVNIRVRPKS